MTTTTMMMMIFIIYYYHLLLLTYSFATQDVNPRNNYTLPVGVTDCSEGKQPCPGYLEFYGSSFP